MELHDQAEAVAEIVAVIVRSILSLRKDAPMRRRIQRHGRIELRPVLGGLHHQYVRI
jgi:hypothetical protein